MFLKVLINVLLMLVYMAIGFVLCKARKVDVNHSKSLSGILVYVLSPAMIINSFIQMEYAKETLIDILKFFFITLIIQLLFFGIIFLIVRKKFADAKYRILNAAAVLGNVGFFGLPLITSLFPENNIVACYSSIYVMSMNLLVFTIGVFMITNDKKYISIKSAILNPTTLSILVALPLFIFNIDFPNVIDNTLGLLAKMVTPMCMFILGIRLGVSNFKALLTRPFVYVACLLKLVIFPLFAYLCVYFIPGLSDMFKVSVFVLSAAPTGAIIVSLAEMYGLEQELSANVVLLTTILSIITLPLLLLII